MCPSLSLQFLSPNPKNEVEADRGKLGEGTAMTNTNLTTTVRTVERKHNVRLPQALFMDSVFGLSQKKNFEVSGQFGVYTLIWAMPAALDSFHLKILMALLSNVKPVARIDHDLPIVVQSEEAKKESTDPGKTSLSQESRFAAANRVWDRLQSTSAVYKGSLRGLLATAGITFNTHNYRKLRQFLLHERKNEAGEIVFDNYISVRISGGGIKESSPSPIMRSTISDSKDRDGVQVTLNWLLTAAVFETYKDIKDRDQRALLKYRPLVTEKLAALPVKNSISIATHLWLAYHSNNFTEYAVLNAADLEQVIWGGGKRPGVTRNQNIKRMVECMGDVIVAGSQINFTGQGQAIKIQFTPPPKLEKQATAVTEAKIACQPEVIYLTQTSELNACFERFWRAYPAACLTKNDKHKASSLHLWQQHNLDVAVDAIVRNLNQRMGEGIGRCDSWHAEKGKYIHSPTTYLTERMWLDPEPSDETRRSAFADMVFQENGCEYWVVAGFPDKQLAETYGCWPRTYKNFYRGIRIVDVNGKPRRDNDILDDLHDRYRGWLLSPHDDYVQTVVRHITEQATYDYWINIFTHHDDRRKAQYRGILGDRLPVDNITRCSMLAELG